MFTSYKLRKRSLTNNERLVVATMPAADYASIMHRTGLSERRVKETLNSLRRKGLVTRGWHLV